MLILNISSSVIFLCMLVISLYLMEAEEVLDGGGRVEDITFSCHHQHEAVQCLQSREEAHR